MFQRDRVDLDWSTLFYVENDKKFIISSLKSTHSSPRLGDYNARTLQALMMGATVQEVSDTFAAACEMAALKFCIEDTSFAQDVLPATDFDKAVEVYARKQYSSKALKNLLSIFCSFLLLIHYPKENGLKVDEEITNRDKYISTLFKLYIYRALKSVLEENVKREYPNLKTAIEKITSGVKINCYVDATKYQLFNGRLDAKSNAYVKEKFNYDFNEINMNKHNSLVMFENKEKLLNLIIGTKFISDISFWENHNQFNWFAFIKSVRELNSDKHAEKLLDYIFGEIQKDDFGKKLLANNLDLIYMLKDMFVHKLELRTFKLTFERFYDKYQVFAWYNGRCYPFSKTDEDAKNIQKGAELFKGFIADVYPKDKDKMLEFISHQIANPTILSVAKKWTLVDILEARTFGYFPKLTDKQAIELLRPDYFSMENVLNRVYLTAYEVGCFTRFNVKETNACLFEIFYDMCQFIFEKLGIQTSYQRDVKWRDDNFCALRDKLKAYNISISESLKQDYIISLLDRKIAIQEESIRFPVLEQLGDAIYGLAVGELLFYNPQAVKGIAKTYEEYIKAESQIRISKLCGFDKLYIGASSLPNKHYDDTVLNPDEDVDYTSEAYRDRNIEKYLADSLEMIIGTICKDCGFEVALNFSKTILKNAYPDVFKEEMHWDNSKAYDDIEMDYFSRILPALYQDFDDNLSMLWQAFNKAFLVMALGTEDKKQRRFITYSFGDMTVYGDKSYGRVNRVFYDYLNNGWDKAFRNYSEFVKQNCMKN